MDPHVDEVFIDHGIFSEEEKISKVKDLLTDEKETRGK